MSGNSCVLYPKASDGKDSKLYKGLLTMVKNRPMTNWFYSSYIASNLGDVLESQGISKNSQGEHSAEEVLKALDWNSIQSEIASLSMIELQIGAIDASGQRVNYSNAKEALDKADAFNDTHTGLTSVVVKKGDVYNIIVQEKNSRTATYNQTVKGKLGAWNVYKQVFNGIGIDIENMPSYLNDTFNAFNDTLVKQLQVLKLIAIDNAYKKDALILFNLDPNSAHIQRLINSFGSIEAAAQALDDINHGSNSYTTGQKVLLKRAFNHCQQMQGLNLDDLSNQIDQMTLQVITSSPEENILHTLHVLNKKYKIDINEIHRISEEIHTLSQAATDAAFVLQRKVRELERQQGSNAEGKRIESIVNRILKELDNKRYYRGVLDFLDESSQQIAQVDTLLQNIPQTGTEMEKAFKTASILEDIRKMRTQYYPIIEALANKALTIDESISQQDIDSIRQEAQRLKDFFDKKEEVLSSIAESTMVTLASEVIGSNTTYDGQSIINVVRMAVADSSRTDFLYSVGRASNPLIASMGSIIRNAQNKRDEMLNPIALRIRRATDRLYKSGSNTEFMYEDDGHIISDIDWGAYKTARTAEIKALYASGLRGFDLKQAIEDWEEQNTEDREVDTKNHRTERVPDAKFRKKFPDLTPAQQEYYDTIMQIKGEIGTLLPSYAQHHYLPPQLRRSTLDALGHAKSVRDVYTALKNKFENFYKVREDDTNYVMNGIIDGDEYKIAKGDFDNTPLKQIPIFFVNKVDQSELLKDFSAGIQALAGTAINYETMSEVQDVIEFMGNFIKGKMPRGKDAKADMIANGEFRVFKDLRDFSKNTNTEALIDGFIQQHLYGVTRVGDPVNDKFWSNVIGYTSFKGLATNLKGMISNYLVGEYQMLIEAGAGEFYNLKNYAKAHALLFGNGGEIMELLSNNMNSKAALLRELFDPINDNFENKSRKRYYKSMFRQLMSHDCSFLGYGAGEYLLHYVNLYAILDHEKVKLNGKTISLYDAFEVSDKQDGNSELKLKAGVTLLNGEPVTKEWLRTIRKRIRGANQSCHGAMNTEDKGLLHRKWWGRAVMNFRQWMVEHYSRRFRELHFDDSLGMYREGYWRSLAKFIAKEDTKEKWKDGKKIKALMWFMKDLSTFVFRAGAAWHTLDDFQKANVRRAGTEFMLWACLTGLSFALGDPDRHKREWWRRMWIYQVKRLLLDAESGMPSTKTIQSFITMMQSPIAGVSTLNSWLYLLTGLTNGDLYTDIKSGDHKGENRYWRNVKKYTFPVFKDIEQLQKLGDDESIFMPFKDTPSNY